MDAWLVFKPHFVQQENGVFWQSLVEHFFVITRKNKAWEVSDVYFSNKLRFEQNFTTADQDW